MTPSTLNHLSIEQNVARDLLAAEKTGKAIKFYEFEVPEFKNVSWTVYGNLITNDIGLIATADTYSVGMTSQSMVLFPPMKDRIFGMPLSDHAVVSQLCSKLRLLYCGELRDHAK
jgi:hypothetical protein